MATYVGIHIKDTTYPEVCRTLHKHLAGGIFEGPLEYDDSTCNWMRHFSIHANYPSIFVVHGTSEKDEVVINFNSFSELPDLAAHLSRELKTLLLVYHHQTTASAYYISTYRDGNQERRIVSGDAEITEESGDKYEFENEQLGEDLSEGDDELDEECFAFTHNCAMEYVESLGFSLDPKSGCEVGVFRRKPWWKFW